MVKPENCALVVVDIQGKLARLVNNSEQLIANTVRLIRCCQALSVPIVVLEQNPQGLGLTVPEIQAWVENEPKFEKCTFSGLGEPIIKSYIQNLKRQNWLVAGIEAHICVYQTACALLDEGAQVELVSDCISSRLPSSVNLAVDNLRIKGANITSVEMCIYEMLQSSKAEQFKTILGLIK